MNNVRLQILDPLYPKPGPLLRDLVFQSLRWRNYVSDLKFKHRNKIRLEGYETVDLEKRECTPN